MLFYQIILYKIDFGATIIQCLELIYFAYREYYFQLNSNIESLSFHILPQLHLGEVHNQGFSFFRLLVQLLPCLFFQLGLPLEKFSLNFLECSCKDARWVLGQPQESFLLLKVPNFNYSGFLFRNSFFRAQVCPILLLECLCFQLPPVTGLPATRATLDAQLSFPYLISLGRQFIRPDCPYIDSPAAVFLLSSPAILLNFHDSRTQLSIPQI